MCGSKLLILIVFLGGWVGHSYDPSVGHSYDLALPESRSSLTCFWSSSCLFHFLIDKNQVTDELGVGHG